MQGHQISSQVLGSSPSHPQSEHADSSEAHSEAKPATLLRLPSIPNWLMTVVFALGGFQVWTGDTLPLSVTPSTEARPTLAWPGSGPASMQVYTHDNVILLARADPMPDPHHVQLDHLVAQRIDATLVVSWSQLPGAPLPMAWTLRIDADRPYLFQLSPQVQRVAIPLLVWPHTDQWRVTLSARTRPDQPRIPSRTLWFRWNPDVDYPESVRTQAMTLETPS